MHPDLMNWEAITKAYIDEIGIQSAAIQLIPPGPDGCADLIETNDKGERSWNEKAVGTYISMVMMGIAGAVNNLIKNGGTQNTKEEYIALLSEYIKEAMNMKTRGSFVAIKQFRNEN